MSACAECPASRARGAGHLPFLRSAKRATSTVWSRPPGLSPRLLDVGGAARYLGISPWTVRDLEAAGALRRVRVPLLGTRELRKVLFDRADLERIIEIWKA